MSLHLGVLGATGLVGRAMLAILEERRFPVEAPRLLASGRPEERSQRFRGRDLVVEPLTPAAFDGLDLLLSAVSNPLAEEWVPVARKVGVVVVDNSSAFRYRAEVPWSCPR